MGSCYENQLLSKIAMSDGHGENSPYFDGWKAYDNDPFHPVHNPEGVIQMGLSENQVWFDIYFTITCNMHVYSFTFSLCFFFFNGIFYVECCLKFYSNIQN